MNFFEAQDFFKKLYPNDVIKFQFDEKCHKIHELIYTDGIPNEQHHIQCDKLRVTIGNQPPVYIPIAPHRMNCDWNTMKQMISEKPNR
jgi:hypothetical protein